MHPLRLFAYCPRCGSSAFVDNDEKSRRCASCGFVYYLNPAAAVVALITDADGRLLVCRRGREPARGTLDLPGGFIDMHETAEEGLAREVREETGLTVTRAEYLFSLPNVYPYSGFDVHTLDLFFRVSTLPDDRPTAMDDAAELMYIALDDLRPEDFGLDSIRRGIEKLLIMENGQSLRK